MMNTIKMTIKSSFFSFLAHTLLPLDVYNRLGGKKMIQSYSNYGLDDVLSRTFMIPAVMPNTVINPQVSMQNNAQTLSQTNGSNNMVNQNKFVNSTEGFLRGNMEAGTYLPYKNMTYLRPVINGEKENALYKIQEMAFAAHDINLYLDTHPNDANAIRLYNEYNMQEKRLNDEYERKYGPIDLSDNEGLSMTPWSWIKEPWPWNE